MAHRAFVYKDGRSFPVKAPIVGAQIERIAKRDGECSAQALVNDAAPESSPLHPLFEWDDPTAANKWRCHTARQVIASIRVTVENAPEHVRDEPAFLPVRREADGDEHEGYRAFAVVRRDPNAWQAWLLREWTHLRGDLERVKFVAEFQPLIDAMPQVEAALAVAVEPPTISAPVQRDKAA